MSKGALALQLLAVVAVSGGCVTVRPGAVHFAEWAKNRIIVLGKVDGQGPFRFLIDTGANGSLFSFDLAQRAHLYVFTTNGRIGGVGDDFHRVMGADFHSLEFGNARASGGRVGVIGLNGGYDGIIGTDVLNQFRLRIDYTHRLLTMDSPANGVCQGEPHAAVRLNGKGPFHFMVDTGWGGKTTIDTQVAEVLGLWLGPPFSGSGIGGIQTFRATQVGRIEAGGVQLDDFPVGVADVARLNATFENIDGVLGHDFLSRFLVTIDCGAGTTFSSPP